MTQEQEIKGILVNFFRQGTNGDYLDALSKAIKGIEAYVKGAEVILNYLHTPRVSNSVCPECGYPKFKTGFEDFERCEGCEWTSK